MPVFILQLISILIFFLYFVIVHAAILRGGPGSNPLERAAFLRAARYNIGGYTFSLLDIEHGILRNASTKPMLLGPLSLDMSFSASDPRKVFALDRAVPNISFVLFYACPSSAPLQIFIDAYRVDDELKQAARRFFLDTVRLDISEKTIFLPALLKTYWADFSENPKDLLKYIRTVTGSKFQQAANEFIDAVGKAPKKTHFAPFDWSPMFIIAEN